MLDQHNTPDTPQHSRAQARRRKHGYLAAKILAVGALGALLLSQGSASAQGYIERPLTLPEGTLRLDLAPQDYAFMDHGALNDARGLRLRDLGDDVGVSLGAGLGYGLGSGFELGGLILPLQLAPDTDVGDLELYGRYAITEAVALQATLQLPTQTETGLGFGLPVYLPLGDAARLETGVELEVIFYKDAVANLDVPLAINFAVAREVFLGLRSGLLLWDFDEAFVNLGVQGGVTVDPAADLTVSFNFPQFITTVGDDAVVVDGWELIFGANIFI